MRKSTRAHVGPAATETLPPAGTTESWRHNKGSNPCVTVCEPRGKSLKVSLPLASLVILVSSSRRKVNGGMLVKGLFCRSIAVSHTSMQPREETLDVEELDDAWLEEEALEAVQDD